MYSLRKKGTASCTNTETTKTCLFIQSRTLLQNLEITPAFILHDFIFIIVTFVLHTKDTQTLILDELNK